MTKAISQIPDSRRPLRHLFSLFLWCSLAFTVPCLASDAMPQKQAKLLGKFNETVRRNIHLDRESFFFSHQSMSSPGVGELMKRAPIKAEDTNSSGVVVVGVSHGALDGKGINSLVVAVSKEKPASKVCLTVRSRDGYYWASNQYELPTDAVAGEMVLLPYEQSRLRRLLTKYSDTEIAIMAERGLCESPERDVLLIGPVGSNRTKLNLFINSAGATDVYASLPAQKRVTCKTAQKSRFSYDYICSLEWPPSQTEVAKIKVDREQYGRKMPETSVIVIRGEP